ncbi:TIGR00730 family Rossman fold protein [Caryophanon latum]|uniref:LOG family protein n=1 Tax=Caryophanon latum TaxID=33977 RepID=UPI000AA78974|nr:TIGR00730 family Rossman fold protein [Caryophanon latum]
MHVAIYCGSQMGKNEAYKEAAIEIGGTLASAGYAIVYGGSKIGLMGLMADAALAQGGHVIGVMPEHLQKRELAHEQLTGLYVVDSMHTRKAQMIELSDALVAMPGGCGTLDEYFEAFTWAQIGLHNKPVILYNVDGFYDALIAHFEKMIGEGFIRQEQHELFHVVTNAQELVALLEQYERVV